MHKEVIRLENAIFRNINANLVKNNQIGNYYPQVFTSPIKFSINSVKEKWVITGPKKTEFLECLSGKYVAEFSSTNKINNNTTSSNSCNISLTPRSYPFFSDDNFWPQNYIKLLSFKASQRISQGVRHHLGARYESFRDSETDISVLDYLVTKGSGAGSTTRLDTNDEGKKKLDYIINLLELKPLLNRWIMGLSNGQMRRARIGRILLSNTKWLILDEPFLGLDPNATEILNKILANISPNPYVTIGMRLQDKIPDWCTHVAYADDTGLAYFGDLNYMQSILKELRQTNKQINKNFDSNKINTNKINITNKEIVNLNNVVVSYRNQKVLAPVNWSIKEGERWHLRGNNGTGKSTILAIIKGDHPASWGSDVSLFGSRRKVGKDSYFSINKDIGNSSPELAAIFPLRLKAWRAIATGYDPSGSFIVPTNLSEEQIEKSKELLKPFGIDPETRMHNLTVSHQKVILFLRAIVRNPKLLLLDEAFSGMTSNDLELCKSIVRNYSGTVISIGHLHEEVPESTHWLRLHGPHKSPTLGSASEKDPDQQ